MNEGSADRSSWFRAALLTAVVVAVVRWLVSLGRDEYAIWPDEPAQLAMARFLGGGTPWNMHNHSVWRPGYAFLLSPVHRITDDPVSVFHAALGLNAVLGGIGAALMVVVARELTPMRPMACAACSALVACAPSMLFTTSFVWSESLVSPIFLATLLALLRLQRSPSLANALIAAACSTAAFATHSRLLPLAAITIGLILYETRHVIGRGMAVVAVTAVAGGTVAASTVSSAIVDRLWNSPSSINSVGAAASRVTDIGPVLLAFAGQSWYLLVSSIGIVGYGVVALGASAGRSSDARRRDATRLTLIVVGACVALSIVFMSGRVRTDQVIYGRYNDGVMAPVLLVGLWWLFTERRRRRVVVTALGVAAFVIASSAALWAWRRGPLSESNGLEPMILGLQPFIRSTPRIGVGAIASSAAVIGAVAVAASMWKPGRRTLVLAPLLLALVVTGSVWTHDVLEREWSSRGDYSVVQAVRNDVIDDGEMIDFYLPAGSDSTNRLMLYEMYLPKNEFTVVSDVLDQESSTFVFAPSDDDRLTTSGAVLLWSDPDHPPFGLWQRSTGS